MNFLELSKQRYSARNYSSDMIEQEKLDYILECARFAPSAVNYQPWHFFIVKSDNQNYWFSNLIHVSGLPKLHSIL